MRFYRPLAVLATLLAFGVVALGAYVRLSDAGLGCPDWPGCYGQLLGVPEAPHEQAAAVRSFPGKAIDPSRAWKEMVHRYFAGTLGLLILALCVLAWRHRNKLAASPALPTLLVGIVAFQALLGMWTVTLLLKPVIVSAHLLGGMTTLSLLVWLALRQPPHRHGRSGATIRGGTRLWALLALTAVVAQIALGGWVSSNYAALACPDFPTCHGAWLPEMDFAHAFTLQRELGQTAGGALLSHEALAAIHWTHRIGALVVFAFVGSLAYALGRQRGWRLWGGMLGAVLLAQISLGIANVLFSLPLPLAVAHNVGAACLLTACVALNLRLWQR